MKKLILAITSVSILEGLVCGFSIPLLIAYISRILFIGKLVGMRTTLGTIIGVEATAFGLHILIPIVMKSSVSLLKLAMFIVSALLIITLAWYDDANYVYIEEEE